jgi:hypothetical protein
MLNVIRTGKDRLKLAQIEEQTSFKARAGRAAAAEKESRLRKEARRQEARELNAPLPPLDANALGHALLKNLGFKS